MAGPFGSSSETIIMMASQYVGMGVSALLIWKGLICPLLGITITIIGFGIGSGITILLKEGPKYNIVQDVQALQKSFVLTEGFGLEKADEDFAKDQLSSVKYGLFVVFMGRFLINMKSLASHFRSIWVRDLPYDCESVAKLMEAGFFCTFSFQLVCGLLMCSCSSSGRRWQLVKNAKNLAGFSSLRFLGFINPTQISRSSKKMMANIDNTPLLILFGFSMILAVMLYAVLGLAVLLSKMGDFDIRGMEAMGVTGMASEARNALMSCEFGALLELKLVKLAMFANQVISFSDIDAVEMERIQLFIFGREDSKYNEIEQKISDNYMEKVATKIWDMPRSMLARSVALMTFGPDDLQKLTVHQDSEEIELKAASVENGLLSNAA